MRKLSALLLALVTVFSALSLNLYAIDTESDDLYAACVSFDNNDISDIHTSSSYSSGDMDSSGKVNSSDVTILLNCIAGTVSVSDSMRHAADLTGDGKITAADSHKLSGIVVGVDEMPFKGALGGSVRYVKSGYYAEISGDGYYSVRIDASGVDFQGNGVSAVVLDTDAALTDLTVLPVYVDSEMGVIDEAAACVSYNGHGYYSFSTAGKLSGVIVTANVSGMRYNVIKAYFCANDYSAKYVIDNSILAPAAVSKRLIISESGNHTAIWLGQMTQDDKTNTNGGMYHDFTNTKWPTVTVDENDKVYIVGSGCRMTHVDPFGATVLVTSEDGGNTFSKPRQISNTVKDDRDAGITYLGEGKFLVSYFTPNGKSYLPDGEDYGVLKLSSSGGSSASWQAASWTAYGEPVGGINGTYVSLLKYVIRTDSSYDMDNHSYVIKSTDYGETWNVTPYELKGSSYSAEVQNMNRNYKITEPGTEVPVSTPHGPVKLSDGTVCWVGKVLSPVDLAFAEIAAYVSHDEGDSWEYRGQVSIPCDYTKQDFQEPDITETLDGVLVCTLRSFDIFTAFSYDKGATWTTPKQAHLEGISHHIMTMPNGDLVLTSAYRYSPKKIYVYVSEDGGRTWSQKGELSRSFKSDDDMGYPSSAYLSDGTIITAYYGCESFNDWNSAIMTTNWTYRLK